MLTSQESHSTYVTSGPTKESNKDIRYVGDIPDHIARSPVKSLIVHMLQVDPLRRATVKDIR